jgi:flavin reductase (NADH)
MATFTEMNEGLKAGMRRLASGVCVISLVDEDANRLAMTATSVTSVSDNPASLLVCINTSAAPYPALSRGCHFCVNLLAAGQGDISDHCAGKVDREARFELGHWLSKEDGHIPYLADAEANFFCENDVIHEYGTHIIVIGKITEVNTSDGRVNPLIHLDGGYHEL